MKKSISYDLLVIIALIAIPLLMFTQLPNINNPYMNTTTPWIVTIMSVLVILTVKLNQRLKIPLLDVMVLTYLLYWHIRFLTLAISPQYVLVLTRTVKINANDFNIYAWAVIGVFFFAVAGFYTAHGYIGCQNIVRKKFNMFNLDKISKVVDISDKIVPVSIYFLSMVAFHFIVIKFLGQDEKPLLIGYLSLLFNPNLGVFLMLLLFFSPKIEGKYKAVVISCFGVFVVVMAIAGSRSTLLNLVLTTFTMMFVLRKKPSFTLKGFLLMLVTVVLIFFSFFYATFQRDLKSTNLEYSVTSIKYSSCKVMEIAVGYHIERCQDLYASIFTSIEEEIIEDAMIEDAMTEEEKAKIDEEIRALRGDVAGMFGYAFARAGYLDFSAEFYMNNKYDEALNFNNYGKSFIDNSVPGSFFDDSKRIQHRIRDIYNPSAIGYQSDAIGVVGENYRLFGYFYPIVIFSIAFVFLCLFSMCTPTILGFYIQYILASSVVAWWNSYGYDTLILDASRELLIGIFVINVVFFNWDKFCAYVRR